MPSARPTCATSPSGGTGSLENRTATGDVGQWLAGASYQVVRTTVNGRDVTVVINGAGELRPLQQLADDLAATLGRPVIVGLRVIPSRIQQLGNYTQ